MIQIYKGISSAHPFEWTIDGAVRVRYIRQEPFFIMFSGTNLLRGSCDMLLQGIIFIDF